MPASARARISGPITRWLASATSGRARSTTSAHGGDVAVDVRGDLLVAEVRIRSRLDAVVAVGHVDGQQPADVGPVDGRARGVAPDPHVQRPAVPVAGGVDPGQVERRRGPGRAGAPRARRARTPRPARRCRRWSRCRAAGSRGRSGRARWSRLYRAAGGSRADACVGVRQLRIEGERGWDRVPSDAPIRKRFCTLTMKWLVNVQITGERPNLLQSMPHRHGAVHGPTGPVARLHSR